MYLDQFLSGVRTLKLVEILVLGRIRPLDDFRWFSVGFLFENQKKHMKNSVLATP